MFGIFSFPPMVSALKKVGEVQTSIPSSLPGVVWEFRSTWRACDGQCDVLYPDLPLRKNLLL